MGPFEKNLVLSFVARRNVGVQIRFAPGNHSKEVSLYSPPCRAPCGRGRVYVGPPPSLAFFSPSVYTYMVVAITLKSLPRAFVFWVEEAFRSHRRLAALPR